MKIAALIPARKGSKGIPGKNFKEFAGKPLWHWSYEAAKNSSIFNEIYVSTDENRPAELCNDTATLDAVLVHHAQEHPEIDAWCLLQPTSPLRTAQDIQEAFAMFNEKDKKGEQRYDSIVSVYSHPVLGWVANSVYYKGRKLHTALFHTEKRPNRQDRKDWYLENGAIYICTVDTLKFTGNRIGIHPGLYVMPKERSVEIDDQIDWEMAEWLMRRIQQRAAA